MATRQKSSPGYSLEEKEHKGELHQFLDHVQANPWLYIAGIAFVAGSLIAGLVYRQMTRDSNREITTEIARAMEQTTPEMKAAELAKLAEGAGSGDAEVQYLAAEAAYDAGRYEDAKAGFETVRSSFPDTDYGRDAMEGLGFIAENNGDYATAEGIYKEIQTKWPDSFTGRRQAYNLGRSYEAQEKYADAVKAYREQLDLFPGSSVAARAQVALSQLELSHPDLFPKEEPVAAPAVDDAAVLPEITPDALAPAPSGDLDLDSLNLDLNVPVDGGLPASESAPAEVTTAPEAVAPADTAPAPAAETPAASEPAPAPEATTDAPAQ